MAMDAELLVERTFRKIVLPVWIERIGFRPDFHMPPDFGFTEGHADAQDGAFTGGIDAQGDEDGAIQELAALAVQAARRSAEALDLVGLLAVEMFVTRDRKLLINEMAPRPHNSGHWTMDACLTDQFEQFVRAVCGLPLGSPERHADARMKNLIGDEIDRWPDILAEPGACLHLYGKSEARPGRKMGHVTRLFPRGSLPGDFGIADALGVLAPMPETTTSR